MTLAVFGAPLRQLIVSGLSLLGKKRLTSGYSLANKQLTR